MLSQVRVLPGPPSVWLSHKAGKSLVQDDVSGARSASAWFEKEDEPVAASLASWLRVRRNVEVVPEKRRLLGADLLLGFLDHGHALAFLAGLVEILRLLQQV